MRRTIDLKQITDGNKYTSQDYVKLGCDGCGGNADCCRNTADTIILDPYDIYMLSEATGCSFSELTEKGIIELRMVDSLALPYLKKKNNACIFLSRSGRCEIHENRPGFCRIFPLGRLYENGRFSYINQIYECSCKRTKNVRVDSWIGVNDIERYEAFISDWHYFTERYEQLLKDNKDRLNELIQVLIYVMYAAPFDKGRGFHEQYEERRQKLETLFC